MGHDDQEVEEADSKVYKFVSRESVVKGKSKLPFAQLTSYTDSKQTTQLPVLTSSDELDIVVPNHQLELGAHNDRISELTFVAQVIRRLRVCGVLRSIDGGVRDSRAGA